MASRPVFVPASPESPDVFVVEQTVDFRWHPGLAPIQKRKNVAALHAAAAECGLRRVLEVSSKSDEVLGRRLSAFSLEVDYEGRKIPLECAFQGSKKYVGGGPYTELYRNKKHDFVIFLS